MADDPVAARGLGRSALQHSPTAYINVVNLLVAHAASWSAADWPSAGDAVVKPLCGEAD
ncbi:MAG: hypothetical protein WKF83_05690 [Nocardioidaceae bacterium]